MADFKRRDIRGWLLHEIHTHLIRTGQTAAEFGKEIDNPKLIGQIISGAKPRIDTVQKILDYIDDPTPAL